MGQFKPSQRGQMKPSRPKEAMDRIAELYLSELRRRIGFANQILMRDNYGDTPAYRLVFGTV